MTIQWVKTFLIFLVLFTRAIYCSDAKAKPHPYGNHATIISFSSDKGVIFDQDSIDILNHPDVADRKIVIYSIVGEFRKGKSFFMDYALRFMYANYKSVNYLNNPLDNKADWIGLPDEPLSGFSWTPGSKRHTTGIVVWSDIFLHERGDEKIAIILLDTQGLFDNNSPTADSMRIFALNSLLSSFLTYNLGGLVKENELEYLQMATGYAEYVMSLNSSIDQKVEKPFQDFVFLVRDFEHVEDFTLGLEGGKKYITDLLEINKGNANGSEIHESLLQVRTYINSTFKNINGFLMPRPGKNATNFKSFNGRWSVLDEDFVKYLKEAIEWMFAPENLKVKRILGKELTSKKFYEFIKVYCQAFKSNEVPAIQSLYEITIEQQMKIINKEALDKYKATMGKLDNPEEIATEQYKSTIRRGHVNAKSASFVYFLKQNKMGSDVHIAKYVKILGSQIDEEYKRWSKNVLEMHSKFIELKKKSDEEVENQRKEYAQKAAEIQNTFEVLLSDEKIRRLKVEADNQEKLTNLTKQREETEEKLNESLKKMTKDHEIKINELRKASRNECAGKEITFKSKLHSMQISHEFSLQNMKDQITWLRNQKAEASIAHQELLKSHSEMMERLRNECRSLNANTVTLLDSKYGNLMMRYNLDLENERSKTAAKDQQCLATIRDIYNRDPRLKSY